MSEKLNTNTQPNDSTDRRKVVPGKKRCDWCERPAAVVYECACKTAEGAVLWYDLDDDCIGTKAPLLGGGPPYRRGAPENTRATNLYGPRPRNGGFRCRDCGTGEYPLFGHTVARHPIDATRCRPCLLSYFKREGKDFKPTEEAAVYFPESSRDQSRRARLERGA